MKSEDYSPKHLSQGKTHRQGETARGNGRSDAKWKYGALVIVCIAAWLGISYEAFRFAKGYVDEAVESVRQENALSVKALKAQIDGIQADVKTLEKSISNAGSTISSSQNVQTRIDERLKNLDNQLKNLEKSLKVLKEAP